MVCYKCKHFSTKTTPSPAQFLLYGCNLGKVAFDIESKFKVKIPKVCKDKNK